MSERVAYDEFGYFADNAAEFGIEFTPPAVRRVEVTLADERAVSCLVWGLDDPRVVLIHGGAQNAHTWDTVALAMDVPLLAPDLPGHGHSGPVAAGTADRLARLDSLADDLAVAIGELAPRAEAVVGMSLGGLTALTLAARRAALVQRLVLVDITPGVTGDKAKAITDFVNGPATFPNLDALLERTMQFNPTRSESSLRRGILHNAVQLDDGSWRWRHRRHDEPSILEQTAGPEGGDSAAEAPPPAEPGDPGSADASVFGDQLWEAVSGLHCPLLLARGLRDQSVVDDADEAELLRRQPTARVEHFADAGHSIQGDMPVELGSLILDFLATT